MRLVQVAKILGMTGQELRKELTEVDFGVRATDREIADNLAQGLIRFIARKKGMNIDIDAAMKNAGAESPMVAETEAPQAEEAAVEVEAPKVVDSTLHVLRKLTLEDVPKEAIDRQKRVMSREKKITKAEMDQRRLEQKAMARTAKPGAEKSMQQQIKAKDGVVTLPAQISVKEFAEKTGVQVPKVIQTLMKNGVMASINQQIDYDTASIVAQECGVNVQRETADVSVEALLKRDLSALIKDEPETLQPRPPIVTVMGHVDHGKTAILDAIRSTNVMGGEAGGITQHIGAYQVTVEGDRKITFIDTPGHEAFTAMRARGAQVTDIAILVVSAEEGVKPTTIEAINHAKDAGVPIVVAINKIDRPNADVERVKGELAGHGLQAEGWGGDVPMVPCSAVTKIGIDTLLSTVLLVADLEELKANPDRPAIATVIESRLDTSYGPLVTVIVNTGTLKVGDIIASGATSGRVKALLNEIGKRQTEALPSAPVVVAGLDKVPQVGDILQVFKTDVELQGFIDAYNQSKAHETKRGFADLVSRLTEGKLSQLKIVLKADTQGSLESIREASQKLTTEKVQPKIIHAAIGAVSESDVMMASASGGIVVGFHVDVPGPVLKTADREGVKIQKYDIIYKLLEELELLLKGLIEPVEEEKITGHLEVRGVFLTKKSEQIIGGKVTDGYLKRMPFRLMRAGTEVGTGRITSLKHIDKDIKEAKEGTECGMRVTTSTGVEVGDILETYVREFRAVAE